MSDQMLFLLLKLETEARSGLRTSPSGSCLSRSEPTVDIWSQIKLGWTGRIIQLLINSLKPLLSGKTDSSSVKSCSFLTWLKHLKKTKEKVVQCSYLIYSVCVILHHFLTSNLWLKTVLPTGFSSNQLKLALDVTWRHTYNVNIDQWARI